MGRTKNEFAREECNMCDLIGIFAKPTRCNWNREIVKCTTKPTVIDTQLWIVGLHALPSGLYNEECDQKVYINAIPHVYP